MDVQTKTANTETKLQGKGKKLFIVVNVDWFFLSHRLPIALEAQRRGYDVTVFAEDTGDGIKIKEHGLKFIALPMVRSSTALLAEFKALRFFFKTYRKERPDIIHHVALKPVTYGSLATRFIKIPVVINALSGMGYVFADNGARSVIKNFVLSIFKFAFNNPRLRFIFQNTDDLNLLLDTANVPKSRCYMIKGSGVELDQFAFSEEPVQEPIRILLPARMLWDKGVGEFIGAAKILKPKYGDRVEFILAGNADTGNLTGISEEELLEINKEGFVEWIGFQTNMIQVLTDSHIICLPTFYREGVPKALIEACAIGRPIVTTDVPGCRDLVQDGKSGYVVPIKNAEAVAEALEKMIEDKSLRLQMGKTAREIAETEYSLDIVLDKHFNIYEGTEKPVG
ncbi:MAG: glycosyltransferase family 4 protein [Bacteroidota bacterium]